VLGLVGEGRGAEKRRTRSLGESWGPLGETVYGILAPENVRLRSYIYTGQGSLTYFRRHEHQRADTFYDTTVKRSAFRRWESAHNRILVRPLTRRHLACCDCILHQTLERRADRHIARQEDALVRAVVRVWKAHERGRLLERVYNARLLRQAWEAWKKRLRHQKKFEGLAAVQSSFLYFYLKCGTCLLDAALAFAQRSQVNAASSALRVWHKRLATQQGAHAFAVQYARVQLQFRILFRWRVQLRAHLKHFRQAKIADKYFMMRRAWRIWVDKAEARVREKRLREWNTGRVGKLFSGTSEHCLCLELQPLELTTFGPAGWKERALRLRRHRLAEQEIRGRIDAVGISVGTCL
jgi:protein SFI1